MRRGLGAVPGGASLLPMDAFRTLELVRRLRDTGQLPEELPVWAVENPLLGRVEARVDRLARKIDAGAEAVLLQPPLLWERHEAWWDRAHARGAHLDPPGGRRARDRLGGDAPVLALPHRLRGPRSAEARALLRDYRAAARATSTRRSFTAFKRQWSADLIGRIRRASRGQPAST